MQTVGNRDAALLETVYLDTWQAMPVVEFETETTEEPLDPSEWSECCHPAYAATVCATANR